jgi:hypothetical protein
VRGLQEMVGLAGLNFGSSPRVLLRMWYSTICCVIDTMLFVMLSSRILSGESFDLILYSWAQKNDKVLIYDASRRWHNSFGSTGHANW